MDVVHVYRYILEYFRDNLFVPTVREMSEHFSCSTSTVHLRLKELEDKGDIIRKKDGSLYRLTNEVMLDLMRCEEEKEHEKVFQRCKIVKKEQRKT